MSTDRRETAGLVVVGASVAGLVTAITAADHGHRVVLVERSKELGGGAATEPEAIAAAGTRFQRVADVDDAVERLLAELGRTIADSEHELARALVPQAPSLVEWLADRCGAQIGLQSKVPSGGHAAARLHAVGEQGGASLITVLARAASHHTHVRIRAATEVDRLLVDEAAGVGGVALRPDRRGATIVAGPVVLASGGFAAADELIAQHCPAVKDLPYFGGAPAKGDTLRLAAPAGAATRNLAACSVTPFLAQPSHLSVPRAVVEHGAILLNQRAQRFANEGAPALDLALAVRGQPGRVGYLIFDERIAAAVSASDPFFARVVLPRTARRGSSIGMLAKQLELPESTLAQTLETYDTGRTQGTDAFGRAAAGPALAAPLYGIRVTGARRATHGGLAVDAAARVLGATGEPIAGLHAVGGAAAGLVHGTGGGFDDGLAGIEALTGLGLARLAALGLAPVPEDEA